MKSMFQFLCVLFCLFTTSNPLSAQWIQTNGPLGGKIASLAVSGTDLFAGTGGGGVFHSTNNGISWTQVNTGLTNTDVLSLADSGANLYAGTNGGGVFHSTNNGAAWTQASAGLTDTVILSLAVSGTDLFAGTNGDGVFRSTDNGTSWTHTGLTISSVFSLVVSGTNLLAGTNGGVFLSTNNGANWTQVNTGLPSTVVSLAVAGTNLFAGTPGGVYHSTNNGASWTQVNTGLTNYDVLSLAVAGTNLFAGTHGGVFLSTDNGTGWTQTSTGLTDTVILSLAVSGTNLFAGTNIGGAWKRPLLEMVSGVLGSTVEKGWNLVSVPLNVTDESKTTLFPAAISSAFAYQGSYLLKDTLAIGSAYWLKFSSAQDVMFHGLAFAQDTVDVAAGWNLIGSISQPIAAKAITTIGDAIITSNFFGYSGRYFTADSIKPGIGYWVKANQSGKLILSAGNDPARSASARRVKIVATSELPPPPPDGEIRNVDPRTPTQFVLEQNYPNPFNPSTVIKYQLPNANFVTLKIANVLGQEIATLVNEMQDAGYKSVAWDATGYPSGVYFCLFQAGTFTESQKLILLR